MAKRRLKCQVLMKSPLPNINTYTTPMHWSKKLLCITYLNSKKFPNEILIPIPYTITFYFGVPKGYPR